MKQTIPAALSALVLVLAAGSVHAQVVNGNFSGLAGWSTAGDAAPVANHLVLTNAWSDGSDDATTDGRNHNVSHDDPWATGGGAGSLEDFAGLAGGAFDPDPDGLVQAYEGSAALQTFTLATGGDLSFQWNFGTTETSGDPSLADVGFVVVDGTVIKLANTLDTVAVAGGDYAAQTGWQSWSTLLAAGSHTIAFGVVDVGSSGDSSALSVTGVGVSSVPESPPSPCSPRAWACWNWCAAAAPEHAEARRSRNAVPGTPFHTLKRGTGCGVLSRETRYRVLTFTT